VIVYAGRLSGIVDVDTTCFGDPIADGGPDADGPAIDGSRYRLIDFWTAAMGIREDRMKILDFYTATFRVDFLGEILFDGVSFGYDPSHPVPPAAITGSS